MPESPQSPITELAAAATLQHEAFRTWIEAGFTEDQALQLLIAVITTTPGGAA